MNIASTAPSKALRTKTTRPVDGLKVLKPANTLTVTNKPKMGRPRAFTSAEALEAACNEYFEKAEANKDVVTMSGLAVHLDVDRKTLVNYSKDQDYFPTIKRARARIEAAMEKGALTGQLNPTVVIFSMKNNFGYSNDGGVSDTPAPTHVTNNTQINVKTDSPQGREIAQKFVEHFSAATIQEQDIIEGDIVS